ncbi:MAG: flagellin, partial [Alteromonas sp.]|nr:flagellin [Alteromonas sp.]
DEEASSIADKINALSTKTGVNADARTQVELSGLTSTANVSFELNGTAISSASDFSLMAKAINEKSGQTGVSAATNDAGNLILTDESGKDIDIKDFKEAGGTGVVLAKGMAYDGTAGAAATLGAATGTDSESFAGAIRLDSTDSYSVTAGDASLASTTAATGSTLKAVGNVDLGTQSGAQDALAIIDGALANIDAQRADLGA